MRTSQCTCGTGVSPVESRRPGSVDTPVGNRCHRSQCHRHRRLRRGFILILVLGLTAVITALGVSFLESNSTAMPEAANRLAASRARYLAESGVSLATHYLIYPPTTVAFGDYWTGGTGISIDTTTDDTDVAILQDSGDPKLFTITAVGTALDPDGTVRGVQTIVAQVIVPTDPMWKIPYGLLGGSLNIPATVQIVGDVHANANVTGLGLCLGNVSAAGIASWPGSGPPASITSGTASYAPPPPDPSLYASYNINGSAYSAYNYIKTNMGKPDSDALNLIDMSATNPGRIIMPPLGNYVIKPNVVLTGTLVIQGNITLDKGFVLTAVPDYPALVVTGDIQFTSKNDVVQINGSVICGGALRDRDKLGVNLTVSGACIVLGNFVFTRTDGTYLLNWDQNRATFWNFAESDRRKPITLLNWQEN